MRNLKKLLAVIVSVCVLATFALPAFAAELTAAEIVEDLGVLKGDSSEGVTDTYLAKGTSRMQAAVLTLRLIGKEDEAYAFEGEDNFADADQTWDNAKVALAYLKANPELGWQGVSESANTFDPKAEISAQQMYKVCLEALGYKQGVDFEWADVFTFAADKGLTLIADVTDMTNNDVATALVEALKATMKDGKTTLIADLVAKGVVTEAAAIAAGLIEAVPDELKVVSVTADNLKQLVVEFNQEIKEAGDEDNYSIETDGNAVVDKDSSFDLLEDKKTVVISLTDAPEDSGEAADQQEEVALTIKKIEAVSGAKFEEVTIEDIELFDNTIPSAESAAVVGKYAIKVVFSEPISTSEEDLEDMFEVDDGDYVVDYVEKLSNNTAANVYLYSALEEGTVSVECANGIKDYAGYGIAKKTFDVEVVEDDEAPVIVGYKDAKPASVTLIFDGDIQVIEDDFDSIYHTNKKNPIVKAAEASGNELKLTFAIEGEDNSLPAGTAYIYIEKEVLQDLWENDNAKISYTIEVTDDKTKPTIDKIEQGDNEAEAELTFSEELDRDSAEDDENYTLLDKNGKEIEDGISSASLGGDDNNVVTITFSDDLSGKYSIVVEDVEDLAGNVISKTTEAFEMEDSTDPEFTDFTAKLYEKDAKTDLLKVSFGEAMATDGKYSVLDLDKYVINTGIASVNLDDVDDVKIKAVDGDKAVEIQIPIEKFMKESNKVALAVGDNLYIARVADAAGNKTVELVSPARVISGIETVDIDTAELTDGKTVVVKLKDKLSKFEADDFILVDHGTVLKGNEYKVKQTVNSDGVTVVTFTLDEDYGTSIAAAAFVLKTKDGTKDNEIVSKNAYGEYLEEGYSEDITDKAAPVVLDKSIVFISAAEIVITLSEDIASGTVIPTGSKNGFSVSGGDAELTEVTVAGNVITLKGKDFTANTNVEYNKVFGLADKDDNKLDSFTRTNKLD